MIAGRWLMIVMASLAACGAKTVQEAGPALNAITFQDGPRLGAPRATHALVRAADGRLLAIGGCVEDGCEPGPDSATVDVISPDARRVEARGALLERRVQPAAMALADGTALVIGGWVGGQAASSTEIFDPAAGRSRPGPVMSAPRASATVAALTDGKVLIAGGYDGGRVLRSAEVFDPATGRLAPVGDLRIARSGATGTLLPDGRILLVGGGDGESAGRRALASAEIFDPATGRFTMTGSLAQRRYKHGAVALPSGDVLIVGGSDERDYGGKLRSVERYDAASGTFRNAGRLASARFKLADGILLVAPGKVLVAAGDDHPELFDVASKTGTLLASDLGGQWNYMTVARAASGTAFLAGGYREGRIQPTDRSWIIRFPA